MTVDRSRVGPESLGTANWGPGRVVGVESGEAELAKIVYYRPRLRAVFNWCMGVCGIYLILMVALALTSGIGWLPMAIGLILTISVLLASEFSGAYDAYVVDDDED